MECYCEPEYEGEYAEVWRVSWHKARKKHFCCECHEPIAVGSPYEKIFSVYDGEASTYRTCEFCAREYESLRDKHPDVLWAKGNDNLACLLVWDMRNQEQADLQRKR